MEVIVAVRWEKQKKHSTIKQREQYDIGLDEL